MRKRKETENEKGGTLLQLGHQGPGQSEIANLERQMKTCVSRKSTIVKAEFQTLSPQLALTRTFAGLMSRWRMFYF